MFRRNKKPTFKDAPSNWLTTQTGHTPAEWFATIQNLIAAASHKTADPRHDATNPELWLKRLAREVRKTAPKSGMYDENMRMASVLGIILVTWSMQTSRAKCHDPRRPVKLRLAALQRRRAALLALLDLALIDEAAGGDYFKGQSWDAPYAEDATDGEFV